MKYVVITTKHHDGFCLFDSAHTGYDVMDAAPFKRDIMKELAEAVRGEGLQMGWYHSIMDWHHPDARGEAFPNYEPVLRAQVEELLTNYGPIGVMWFDGEWIGEWTTESGRSLYDLCRRLQPGVLVNNRVGKGRQGMQGMTAEGDHPGDFGTPEQEVPETGLPGVDWESCMTMNDTWGFKTADLNWKSSRTLIETLIEVVSKGGNFLLNVGPTAEGEIPAASVERLAAVGEWLRANGESIEGAGASPFMELDWGRCTSRPGVLYLHVLRPPDDGRLLLPGLLNGIRDVRRLGGGDFVRCGVEPSARGPVVVVPRTSGLADRGALPVVYAVTIAGEAAVVTPPEPAAAPDPEGTVVLLAEEAQVIGQAARFEPGPTRDCIGFWTRAEDEVVWPGREVASGRYRVVVEYACAPGWEGSRARIEPFGPAMEFEVRSTGGWGRFKRVEVGELDCTGGQIPLGVSAISMPGGAVMNLRSVRLIPAETR